MLKKSLALLLTLVMVLSLAPISAFAAETTSYDTVQLPAKLPKAVSFDGYITQGDGYHAFGIVANNVFTEIPVNSISQNYAMADVAKALLDAQTHTYFFAQDDTKYYFGIKLDRKSVNVDGYNYFTSQQDIKFNIGFKANDPTSYITVNLPIRNGVKVGTSAPNLVASDSTIQKGLARGGAGTSYFNTEPTYNTSKGIGVWEAPLYTGRVAADNRSIAEGTVIGNSAASSQLVGASVFTYEFSITKASVEAYLGEGSTAPNSIYFQASSTGMRYGSMNDLTLATMAGVDSFDATFSLGSTNALSKVEFVGVDANNCEHTYVENPIDSFLVNKENWVSNAGYYGAVSPTTNNVVNSRLRCGQAPEYYVSCSKCRTAGTETFYGEVKQHSFVIRGDIVSSEITACDAENPSRLTYEYKCAWCDETKELPLGDYIHNYKDIGSTKLQWTNRCYSVCDNEKCVYLKTEGEQKLAAWYKCTSSHDVDTATFARKTDIAATCTTPAVTVYECAASKSSSYCQYTVTKTTAAAKGHTEVVDKAVAPGCESTGLTEGSHCSVCKKVLVAQTEVAATGHTPAAAVVENDNASTCTVAGSYDEVVYCSVCKAELSRKTMAKDLAAHTPAEAVVENEVPSTCTVAGSYDEVVYCSVCNAELSRETKAKDLAAHTPAEAVVENEVPSTCTVAGSYDEVVCCSVCNAELSRKTKAKELAAHTPAQAVVENEVPSTCTVAGSYDEVVCCSVCNAELSRETKAKELAAHTEEEIPAVDAECGKTGLTAGVKCSVCGDILTAQEETPALEHNYDAEVTDPDFGKQGYTTHTCSNCGDVYVDSYVDAKVAVASVGEANYETLQAAIDAAQAGETVVLLADVEIDTYVAVRNAITLDLNGKTITYTGNAGYGAIYVSMAGDLTVIGSGLITAANDHAIGVYGKVTVEAGSFVSGDEMFAGLRTFYYNETTYGTAVVNGGTFNRIQNCGVMTINGGTVTECVDNTHKIAINNGEIAELIFGEADYAPVFGTVTEINGGNIAKITSPVQIGGNNYASVEEAVEAAEEGDTIILADDCTAEAIMVPVGVTLDLNGKTLKVESFNAFGDVVDGTMGGESLLIVAIGECTLESTNSFLPVYDTTGEESGYRFYSFELPILNKEVEGDSTKTRFGVCLTFANDAAYEIIESGDAGLEIGLRIEIEGYDAFEMTYRTQTLKDYVALMQRDDITGTPVMAVTITGLDKLEAGTTIKAYTTVRSTTSVSAIGDVSVDLMVG